MALAILVFFLVTGSVMGSWVGVTRLPGLLAARRLDRRLREVSQGPALLESPSPEAAIVMRPAQGPWPSVARLVAQTKAGARLTRLIEQSGVRTTPSAMVLAAVVVAAAAGIVAAAMTPQRLVIPVAAAAGGAAPFAWLTHRRATRFKRFEEQFPEALDLMSRAIRAGHALQTSLGMVAEELPPPVGPEFKKIFDQQNFGLPLRDALNQLSERVTLLDVRFFATAVLIQRDTGGNLSEILDNLAHVVRERFKIHRQVRVHTAHGRFTGYVLLGLPAALAVALAFINPEHMQRLFQERMGQMMLMGAVVMQTIGFFWIRKVIKIEV